MLYIARRPVHRLLFRSICLSFGHPTGKQKVLRACAKIKTNCAYVIYLGWWGHFHLLKSFWCPAHWSALYTATIYGSTSDIDTENHLFLIDFRRLKARVSLSDAKRNRKVRSESICSPINMLGSTLRGRIIREIWCLLRMFRLSAIEYNFLIWII